VTNYIRPYPRSITILIDNREKNPLLFPNTLTVYRANRPYTIILNQESRHLSAGDYTLKDYPLVGVERKASFTELAQNFCTRDWPRQQRALHRLTETYSYPLLLLEVSPATLLRSSLYTAIPPTKMLSRLFAYAHSIHLPLWVINKTHSITQRYNIGTLVAYLLIGGGRIFNDSERKNHDANA